MPITRLTLFQHFFSVFSFLPCFITINVESLERCACAGKLFQHQRGNRYLSDMIFQIINTPFALTELFNFKALTKRPAKSQNRENRIDNWMMDLRGRVRVQANIFTICQIQKSMFACRTQYDHATGNSPAVSIRDGERSRQILKKRPTNCC